MNRLRSAVSLSVASALFFLSPGTEALAAVAAAAHGPASAPAGGQGVAGAQGGVPSLVLPANGLSLTPSLSAASVLPSLQTPAPAGPQSRPAAAQAAAVPQAAAEAAQPAAALPRPAAPRARAVAEKAAAPAQPRAQTAFSGLKLDLPASKDMGLAAAHGQETRNFAARLGDEHVPAPGAAPVPLKVADGPLRASLQAPAAAAKETDPLFSSPKGEFKNFKYLLDPDGVASVAFSRTPINALSLDVIEELHLVVDKLAADPAVRSVVITGEGPTFLAGADINLLYSVKSHEHGVRLAKRLQNAFDKLEAMDKPVVMAINGYAVGGGMEIAMSGHVRYSSEKAEYKLPEVELGILPAAGAPQRLPRLIGLIPALKLLMSGEAFDAATALKLGLVDRVLAPADVLAEARKEAKRLADLPAAERAAFLRSHRTISKPVPLTLWERIGLFFDGWLLKRQVIRESSRANDKDYQEAIMKIIDATLIGARKGPQAGLEAEADYFGELASKPTAKILTQLALRRHGGPRVKRYGEKGAKPLPVERVAVVGGGVMGSAIAGLAAYNGLPVTLKDVKDEYLEGGLAKARALIEELGRREKADVAKKLALVAGTVDDAALAQAKPSLLIEAIRENEAKKAALFERLGSELPPETIFASNTSVLSINKLARASGRPERFLGLHYFNPVDKLALVELIVPDTAGFTPEQLKTLDQTIATALAYLKKTGRVTVATKDSPGFAVNRVLLTYLNEANALVEEGASVEQVDAVMRAFGLPMGPFELADHVGLGLAAEVGGRLAASLPHFGPLSGLMARLKAMAGSTYHVYKAVLHRKSGRVRSVRQGANEAVVRQAAGTPARPVSDEQVRHRLLLVMANEAMRLVGEGVVESPLEADLALSAGMGFPVSTGGLLRWTDAQGLGAAIAALRHYAEATGRAVYEPAPALLAAEGKGLYPEAKP